MTAVAAAAAVLFGALHLVSAVALLARPTAPRRSGDPGAVPGEARAALAVAALACAVGGVLLAVGKGDGEKDPLAVVLVVAGTLAVCGLALANGYWMHGAPTWSHHAVRLVLAVAVVGLALAAS